MSSTLSPTMELSHVPLSRAGSDPLLLQNTSLAVSRYGLVVILAAIGGMKFTAVEAEGIRPFVENSPFMAWTYPVFGIRGLSDLLGLTELAVAAMIASRRWLPVISLGGSVLAIGMFLTTLSFMLTTPGVWDSSLGGFPALGMTGQFLIKDLALLGVACMTAAEAWRACRQCQWHVAE